MNRHFSKENIPWPTDMRRSASAHSLLRDTSQTAPGRRALISQTGEGKWVREGAAKRGSLLRCRGVQTGTATWRPVSELSHKARRRNVLQCLPEGQAAVPWKTPAAACSWSLYSQPCLSTHDCIKKLWGGTGQWHVWLSAYLTMPKEYSMRHYSPIKKDDNSSSGTK